MPIIPYPETVNIEAHLLREGAILVEDHRHCLGCGRAIARREQFCSAECEQNFIESAQKERRRNLIFLVALAMFISLLFIIQLFYG